MKKMYYGLDKNSKFIITDIKQELFSDVAKKESENAYELQSDDQYIYENYYK